MPGEEAQAALLESDPDIYVAAPHFDGSLSFHVRLDRISRPDLEEAIVEALRAQAPKRSSDRD